MTNSSLPEIKNPAKENWGAAAMFAKIEYLYYAKGRRFLYCTFHWLGLLENFNHYVSCPWIHGQRTHTSRGQDCNGPREAQIFQLWKKLLTFMCQWDLCCTVCCKLSFTLSWMILSYRPWSRIQKQVKAKIQNKLEIKTMVSFFSLMAR